MFINLVIAFKDPVRLILLIFSHLTNGQIEVKALIQSNSQEMSEEGIQPRASGSGSQVI